MFFWLPKMIDLLDDWMKEEHDPILIVQNVGSKRNFASTCWNHFY